MICQNELKGKNVSNQRAYSRPLLSVTIAPDLVPSVLRKIFWLEMVKNVIRVGGASKQNALFSENMPPQKSTQAHNALNSSW